MSVPVNLCTDLTNKINAENGTIQLLNGKIKELKEAYEVKLSYEAIKAYQEKIAKAFNDTKVIKDLIDGSGECLKKESKKTSTLATEVLQKINNCSRLLIQGYEEIESAEMLLSVNSESSIDLKKIVGDLAKKDEDFKKSEVNKNFDSILQGLEEISLKSKDAISAILAPMSTTFSMNDFTEDTGRLNEEIAKMLENTDLASQQPYYDSIQGDWEGADKFKTELDTLLAQQNLSAQIIDMCNAIKKSNGCPE